MKQRLSSPLTIWYKRLFPALSYGLPLLWVVIYYLSVSPETWRESGKIVAVIAFVILVHGLFMSQKFAAEPVEEVWMEGDDLLVKNKGKEGRIPMSAIAKMSPSRFMNPKRLTVELSRPSEFGERIIFILPGKKGRPVLEEFVQRLNRVHTSPPNSSPDLPPS